MGYPAGCIGHLLISRRWNILAGACVCTLKGISYSTYIAFLNYLVNGLMTVRIGSAASLNTVQNVLSRRPDIEYVEKNYVVQAFDIPNDPLYGNQYHLPRIDAPIAWDYEKGNGNRH